MSRIFCSLVAALCLAVPVAAQADAKAKETPKAEAKTDPKADKKEAKAEVDTLKIFRTKGNTWTFKLADGTFEKHEVTEVTEKKASVKLTSLDKDRKETAFDFYTVSLKDKAKTEDKTPSKVEEEKLTVGTVILDCTHAQFYSSGGTLHTWTSKDFHMLVKEQWVSKTSTDTRRELVEIAAK